MKTVYFTLKGTIRHIGAFIQFKKKIDNTVIKKRVLTIETIDHQKLYPEARGKKMHILNGYKIGDFVEIQYTFRGSEKNGKKYNNIYLHTIRKL